MMFDENYFFNYSPEEPAVGQQPAGGQFLAAESPSPGYVPAAGWGAYCSHCSHYNCHPPDVVCPCYMPQPQACDGAGELYFSPNGFDKPVENGWPSNQCFDFEYTADLPSPPSPPRPPDDVIPLQTPNCQGYNRWSEQCYLQDLQDLQDLSSPRSPSTASSPPGGIMAVQTQTRPQIAKFLKRMLDGPDRDQSLITWSDREKGIFRVVNSRQLATLWGKQKNRPNMTFAKMARGIRERRKAGDFVRLTSEEASRLPRRLVFKFGEKCL